MTYPLVSNSRIKVTSLNIKPLISIKIAVFRQSCFGVLILVSQTHAQKTKMLNGTQFKPICYTWPCFLQPIFHLA